MNGKLAIGWYALFAVGMALPAVAAAKVAPLPKAEVEQAVIAAIPAWQGRKATVLKYLDLTRPFDTASPWTLVVAQDPKPPADPDLEDHGPIATCLVKALVPQCTGTGKSYPTQWPAPSWYFQPYELSDTRIVYGGQARTKPLLLVKTCSGRGGDGNCSIETDLYRYHRQSDLFREVFTNESGGSNNNQASRFVGHGPLTGDVIVDYPTSRAPYVYWIEVYSPGKTGQYARVLRYRSHTRYGDGNPLPVADSEMTAIMQRLGLWKPGDALPVPPNMPSECGRLVLRHAEEWCQNLCRPLPGSDCRRDARSAHEAARDR